MRHGAPAVMTCTSRAAMEKVKATVIRRSTRELLVSNYYTSQMSSKLQLNAKRISQDARARLPRSINKYICSR